MLSGVVVLLTGSSTLQVLLGVAAQSAAAPPSDRPGRWVLLVPQHTSVRPLEEAIALVGGVRRVSEVRVHADTLVTSTDCSEIAERLDVDDCVTGSAYLVGPGPQPGTRLTVDGKPWVVPRYEVLPESGGPDSPDRPHGLVVAGGADPVLSAIPPSELVVRGDPDESFGDRLLAATSRADRGVVLRRSSEVGQVELFTSPRGGVIDGSVLPGLLAVIVLAVIVVGAAAVGQVFEHRRHTAPPAVNGVPPEVLAVSALWQSAIPAALGIGLAVPVGLGTAWLIAPADRFRVAWAGIATTVAAAAVVVLAVSLCTRRAPRSAIGPASPRTEQHRGSTTHGNDHRFPRPHHRAAPDSRRYPQVSRGALSEHARQEHARQEHVGQDQP